MPDFCTWNTWVAVPELMIGMAQALGTADFAYFKRHLKGFGITWKDSSVQPCHALLFLPFCLPIPPFLSFSSMLRPISSYSGDIVGSALLDRLRLPPRGHNAEALGCSAKQTVRVVMLCLFSSKGQTLSSDSNLHGTLLVFSRRCQGVPHAISRA